MSFTQNNPSKFTFIHIPKNAGTAIKRMMKADVRKNKHCDIYECRELWGDELGFTFAVVRNPWDRMVSYYNYMKKQNARVWKGVSFEQFIMSEDWLRVGKQQHEYFDEVDMVLRYENIEEDLKTLFDKMGFKPTKLRVHNRSKWKGHYSDFYNDKTKEEVYRRCRVDIDKFGYTFEENKNDP